MKRPSDQAKLVFLGLLRTASALAGAAEPRVASMAAASWHSLPQPHTLTLRLARRTDVPSIQRCNLATLPENYNAGFYTQHLRQWPDLSLVIVEDKPTAGHNSPFPGVTEENVVAYLLGKTEEQTSPSYRAWTGRPFYTESVTAGHVTSLAVMPAYRRQGLAAALMDQLHHQLNTDRVGLHVRPSNQAATRLYERLGYRVHERIPSYYHDGEDGYYMLKMLKQEGVQQDGQRFYWKTPDNSHLVMPRSVGPMPDLVDEDSTEPELLSGTL